VFHSSAAFYDSIYSWKDYRSEAAKIAEAIRARNPRATSLLDVACGTAEHARHLVGDHGFRVDGIDIEPAFVDCARAKIPDGGWTCADMVDFDLGRRYDAVICMFSSIGYVRDIAGLVRATTSMAAHLAPDGVLVIEPWFEPGTMEDGHITSLVADIPGGKIMRMSHTSIEGCLSRLHFEYLIGQPQGLTRAAEVHELGLFTREEVLSAFRSLGLEVTYDPTGITGRGLYIGLKPA
jgi:SAM-dependent methyltransferase